MLQQRFEDEEALRREHMTDEEARAVVELWAETEKERERRKSMPSVADLAEGLQVPVEEAHALLAQVRERQAQTTAQTQVRQRSTRSRWVAMLVAALFAVAFVLLLSLMHLKGGPEGMPPQPVISGEVAPTGTTAAPTEAAPAAPPVAEEAAGATHTSGN